MDSLIAPPPRRDAMRQIPTVFAYTRRERYSLRPPPIAWYRRIRSYPFVPAIERLTVVRARGSRHPFPREAKSVCPV